MGKIIFLLTLIFSVCVAGLAYYDAIIAQRIQRLDAVDYQIVLKLSELQEKGYLAQSEK